MTKFKAKELSPEVQFAIEFTKNEQKLRARVFERNEQIAAQQGVEELQSDGDMFLAAAQTDRYVARMMRLAVIKILEDQQPLPGQAQEWLLEYLRETEKCMKLETTVQKGDTAIRDVDGPGVEHVTVIKTVNAVHKKFGAPCSRNDTSPPHSACDFVAEARAALRLNRASFGAIKTIWLSSDAAKNIKNHVLD